jgi:transporter family protein
MFTNDTKAILLALGAGVCWGIGEFFTKQVLRSHQVGPLTAVAIRVLVDMPLVWIAWYFLAYLPKSEQTSFWQAEPAILIKLVIGAGVFAGAAGLILFYSSLHVGEISTVKPIAFTVAPAVGVLLGAMFLGEPLTVKKILGVLCVLAGVVLIATK